MADIELEPNNALTFRIRAVDTIHAECDLFIASSEAPKGRFFAQAQVKIRATPGSPEQFRVSLSRSVTGKPRDAEEPVAFAASCTVACIAEFSRAVALDDIPHEVIAQIAFPLFHISTERCRTMVTWMGFPAGPAVTVLPKFEIVKEGTSEVDPTAAATKNSRARPKASAKKATKPT